MYLMPLQTQGNSQQIVGPRNSPQSHLSALSTESAIAHYAWFDLRIVVHILELEKEFLLIIVTLHLARQHLGALRVLLLCGLIRAFWEVSPRWFLLASAPLVIP